MQVHEQNTGKCYDMVINGIPADDVLGLFYPSDRQLSKLDARHCLH
jgi:hypothetical protein